MSFVITNGKKFYYPDVKTNKIRLTECKEEAFIFLEKATAIELIKRATSKLKGYRVEPYDSESDCSEDVVKVKRVSFSPAQREEVYNKCEGRCGICGKFVPHSVFTVDHIIPLSRGGANTIDNLQCACKSCNTIK